MSDPAGSDPNHLDPARSKPDKRRKITISAAQPEEIVMTVYHALLPNFYLSDNFYLLVSDINCTELKRLNY